MLAQHGHDTILYGSEKDESEASEHVVVATKKDRKRWFGKTDWHEKVFDQWDPTAPCWREMNATIVREISRRIEPDDIIGITMGRCQQAIADAFPQHVIAEVGVGYDGILANSHCAFESQTWRHHVYGLRGIADGRSFDTVIPNSFRLDELTRADSDGYLLFLGRHTERKGLEVVRELAQRYEVITAGQDGPLDGIPWRDVVTGDEKAKLIAGARAVLCPTVYLEPFGGVAVEAMLSGVPVITSDFGAFTETLTQGVTGFRCNTLHEYAEAVAMVDQLDRDLIAKIAATRYSTDAVAPLYDRWLTRLATLYRAGWYEP